ncbi:MAG: 30S ribosomal protein S6 [Candidatus Brocadiia bacterium]
MRIYEGMFVLDDGRFNSNPESVTKEVRGLLERHQAELFTCEKWDERRLAYPIEGHTRGVYLLTRFTAPPGAMHAVERDARLNDTILRVLIIRDIHTERLHQAGLFPPTEGAKEEEAEEATQEQEPQGQKPEEAKQAADQQAPSPGQEQGPPEQKTRQPDQPAEGEEGQQTDQEAGQESPAGEAAPDQDEDSEAPTPES